MKPKEKNYNLTYFFRSIPLNVSSYNLPLTTKMSTLGGPLPLRCLDPGEQNSKFLKFYGLSLVFWYWHQKRLLAWKRLRMPTSLGQCYHTKIFLSKEMADSMCPDKKGFLFGIGRFILIAGNIVLVSSSSQTTCLFFSIMFLKKTFIFILY